MKPYLELSDLFHEESLDDRLLNLAKRVRAIRKRRKMTQAELADRSFVSYASIKRFECTGKIALESFFLIADALGIGDELDQLFRHIPPTPEEVHHGR